jgi:hypothetical protein
MWANARLAAHSAINPPISDPSHLEADGGHLSTAVDVAPLRAGVD